MMMSVPAPEPSSWARAALLSTAPWGAGVKGAVVHANENGTRANGRALVLPKRSHRWAHASGMEVGRNQVLFCQILFCQEEGERAEGVRADQRGEAERLHLRRPLAPATTEWAAKCGTTAPSSCIYHLVGGRAALLGVLRVQVDELLPPLHKLLVLLLLLGAGVEVPFLDHVAALVVRLQKQIDGQRAAEDRGGGHEHDGRVLAYDGDPDLSGQVKF